MFSFMFSLRSMMMNLNFLPSLKSFSGSSMNPPRPICRKMPTRLPLSSVTLTWALKVTSTRSNLRRLPSTDLAEKIFFIE